jgi:CheY-like chemotaxis protein
MQENAVVIDEYTEGQGYSVYDSQDAYFKQEALENAQAQTIEPLQGDILSAKLCKNNNIMLFVKLPDGAKVNIFLSVAEVQALGIPLAVTPIYAKTPKGVSVITGYEVCNDSETLKSLFYGKKCLVARIMNYTITEIW